MPSLKAARMPRLHPVTMPTSKSLMMPTLMLTTMPTSKQSTMPTLNPTMPSKKVFVPLNGLIPFVSKSTTTYPLQMQWKLQTGELAAAMFQ